MQFVMETLALTRAPVDKAYFPVVWSEEERTRLVATSRGEGQTFSSVDVVLAEPLLRCADGALPQVQAEIIRLLEQNIEQCAQDNEIFISFIRALFVSQRFDLVTAMLRDRYGFGGEFTVEMRDSGPGVGRVQWEIPQSGPHRFVFDSRCLRNGQARVEILIFQWEFPLFANYSRQSQIEHGTVLINREDVGTAPGLAYCDNRPDFFLIPDYLFVPSRAYAYVHETFRNNAVPWVDRTSIAFWRGGTTGVPKSPGDWRSLERIRLCEIARSEPSGIIDAGLSSIVQFHDPEVIQKIGQSGLTRSFVPWTEWNRFKYLIDIDGNSSPWSNLFQKLLTGSPVLKVESSRGLQQWFYDGLVPWINYVPIAPDISDLVDKVRFLIRHDSFAERIGRQGLEFAESLTYENELRRSVPVISAAFRYFRGEQQAATPYGRVVERSLRAG